MIFYLAPWFYLVEESVSFLFYYNVRRSVSFLFYYNAERVNLFSKPYVVTNHALMKIFIMIMVLYTDGMINIYFDYFARLENDSERL